MRHPSNQSGIYSGTTSTCHPGRAKREPGPMRSGRALRGPHGCRITPLSRLSRMTVCGASALPLRARLIDLHRDAHLLVGAALARAADRRGAEIVESGGDPHVAFGRADAVGGVEPNPT